MSAIEDKVIELTDKLVGLGAQVGPAAFDATLSAVRLAGIADIVTGALAGVIGIAVYRHCTKFVTEDNFDDMPPKFIGGLVGSAAGVFLMIVAVVSALNTVNWVSAVNPQAGLALRIVKSIDSK